MPDKEFKRMIIRIQIDCQIRKIIHAMNDKFSKEIFRKNHRNFRPDKLNKSNKNTFERPKNILYQAEQRASELEDKTFEITQ